MLQLLLIYHICITSHVVSDLSAIDEPFKGAIIDSTTVTANTVYNHTQSGNTFAHDGADDNLIVGYYMPSPANFKNRFLATGGGAYAINSASSSAPGGVMYGAAAEYTDGGFGGFGVDFDTIFLLANGTINWPAVYMFGYEAIKEMTTIGKPFTQQFYGVSNSTGNATKLYTYYQGCSELSSTSSFHFSMQL